MCASISKDHDRDLMKNTKKNTNTNHAAHIIKKAS
jgi:hypothetical protein